VVQSQIKGIQQNENGRQAWQGVQQKPTQVCCFGFFTLLFQEEFL
jgi:hypothetical protein